MRKLSTRARNNLTSEVEVDNLEKFAKTSLVAEVILDRPMFGRQEVEREI